MTQYFTCINTNIMYTIFLMVLQTVQRGKRNAHMVTEHRRSIKKEFPMRPILKRHLTALLSFFLLRLP